jgi:hypothetical protein
MRSQIRALHYFALVAVFISGATPLERMHAIEDSVNAYNAANALQQIKLFFFVGKQSHPYSANFSNVIVGNFDENMNDGKSFEWLKLAAMMPDVYFVIKSDDVVAVDWAKLVHLLSSASNVTYFGSLQTNELCGNYSYCPPPNCTNMSGDCWVYMSGGFYGMSQTLVKSVALCEYSRFHNKGYEDLVTGKMIKHCVPDAHLFAVPNGQAWCHSKLIDNQAIKTGVLPASCIGVEITHKAQNMSNVG